jgi:hypothetical protein
MKKIKSFDEFINEGVLPEWARPNGDYSDRKWLSPNFEQHMDPRQSMTRFTVGDRVVEVETGVEGIITSMGDGMNTITWKNDAGERVDSYAQELDKIVNG